MLSFAKKNKEEERMRILLGNMEQKGLKIPPNETSIYPANGFSERATPGVGEGRSTQSMVPDENCC